MTQPLTDSRPADLGARLIFDAFTTYREQFKKITQRAKVRFKDRDWRGMRNDAAERLDLYKDVVDQTESDIRRLLGKHIEDKLVWSGMKTVYSAVNVQNDDWELAETFFNSITRRIFATVGVDSRIEFVKTNFETPPTTKSSEIFRTYKGSDTTAELIQKILEDYLLRASFQNLPRDADLVAAEIEDHIKNSASEGLIDRIEIVKSVFYRGMGAYLIGRIYTNITLFPLAIALLNLPQGIVVDGVLLKEDDVSILFSFTRSYFHVEAGRPYDLVHFLKTILPRKRLAELYISTGFNKHGKTEMYRELMDHLTVCYDDRFATSPGERGMVMIVFNMPNDDLVFKLIRDKFDTPKNTTRQEVMEKYDLVFKHDRAGRLVDAQEFEHLKFDACCFSPKLLDELIQDAGSSVRVENEHLILDHAYVERRVTPLNIFLREVKESEARKAVIDWGNAIKELAVSNIFPGDVLLKNFGVTRHGRVVFYDYDELCPLTSCNFRKLPPSASYEDELASEPWFYVEENDVFPEEFVKFLALSGPLREVFLQHHSDLFEADYWQQTQNAIKAGELQHIFPYSRNRRLKRS